MSALLERHGIGGVSRAVGSGGKTSVTIEDREDGLFLIVSSEVVILTPAQAELLAEQLISAATRAERRAEGDIL